MARADFGGQALLEGVLMRGRTAIGVALRHPDGSIVATSEPLNSILHRNRFARAPFVRGIVLLYETLVIGTRWLMRSGSIQAEGEGEQLGRGTIAITLIVTLALAVGLFVLLPLFLADATTRVALGPDQALLQHLLEGLIRVAIFVGYLLIVSRSAEIKRTFQYHGAEHMTIHALEHEDPLDVEHVRKYPTAHPRCGTEFLVIFIILSILMFSLLVGQSLLVSIVGRILLIPVIASLAYDLSMDGTFYKTMMGVSPEAAAEFVAERGAHIVALNCGTGMDMKGAAMVARIYREHCGLPIMVQPNAGLPVLENLKAVYKQLPADTAREVPAALEAGAAIVGSCCGSTPDHTQAIWAAVDSFNRGR